MPEVSPHFFARFQRVHTRLERRGQPSRSPAVAGLSEGDAKDRFRRPTQVGLREGCPRLSRRRAWVERREVRAKK